MTMPKLELSAEHIDKLQIREELYKFFEILKSEQGENFEIRILLMGLVQIDFAKGFCYAYMLIREALMKESIGSENVK